MNICVVGAGYVGLVTGAVFADLGNEVICVDNVADKIRFVEGDMRTFVADPAGELVIIPFRGFQHLLTVDDQLAALASIRRSLVSGGLLVLNLILPDPEIMVAQHGRKVSHGDFTDERGRRCEMWGLPEYDVTSQLLRLRVGLDVYDGDRPADTIETAFDLRLLHRYETEHLLTRAGFEIEQATSFGGALLPALVLSRAARRALRRRYDPVAELYPGRVLNGALLRERTMPT